MNKEQRISAYINFFNSKTIAKQDGKGIEVFRGYPLGYRGQKGSGIGIGGMLKGSLKMFIPLIMKLAKFITKSNSSNLKTIKKGLKKTIIRKGKQQLKKQLIDNLLPTIGKHLSTVPRKLVQSVQKKISKSEAKKHQTGGKKSYLVKKKTEKNKKVTKKKNNNKKNNKQTKRNKKSSDIYKSIL